VPTGPKPGEVLESSVEVVGVSGKKPEVNGPPRELGSRR